MKRVWKYALQPGRSTYKMPLGSRPLHVAVKEDGQAFVWVEIDDSVFQSETKMFIIYRTGEQIDPNYAYIGTFHYREYVWHVYERSTQ
jgi:hypothetical protein